MKKELLVLTIALGMAAALTASGQSDGDQTYLGRGPAGGRGFRADSETVEEFRAQRQEDYEAWTADQELITVTGTLKLINGQLPLIESDGVMYSIMAPWYDLGEIELTEGMTVSVEGYETPGLRFQWDGTEKSLMATKAVINGEVLEIDHTAYGAGSGRGLMGGADSRGGSGRQGRKGGSGGGMMSRRF